MSTIKKKSFLYLLFVPILFFIVIPFFKKPDDYLGVPYSCVGQMPDGQYYQYTITYDPKINSIMGATWYFIDSEAYENDEEIISIATPDKATEIVGNFAYLHHMYGEIPPIEETNFTQEQYDSIDACVDTIDIKGKVVPYDECNSFEEGYCE